MTSPELPEAPSSPDAPQGYGKEWAGLLALLLVLFSLEGYWLWTERSGILVREQQRLETQARALELNIERQLLGINAALAGVRYDLVSGDRSTETYALTLNLKVLADAMPGVSALLATNALGELIASNRPRLVLRNVTEQAFFKVPQSGLNATTLYVSPPYLSPAGGLLLNVTRVMMGTDGKFFGVVSAALDPQYLEIVMRSVLYADDMVVRLVHGDGKLLLSSPENEQSKGADPGLDSHLGDRMVAIRSVMPLALHMDKPLVVEVSRSLSAVQGPWRIEVLKFIVFGLLVTLATCGALYFNQRRRAAREASRAQAEDLERRSAQRLEFALKGADLGLWDWNIAADEMVINDRQWKMLGYTPGELSLTSKFWRGSIHPDDQAAVLAAFVAHVNGDADSYKVEHRMRHKRGHWVWVLNHAMVVTRNSGGSPTRVLGTHLDITARKRVEADLAQNAAELTCANAQLSQLSVTDGLTGVGNRRLFDETLATEWARGARQEQPLALLMIDIDHFKLYNDSYGHQGGDDCLRRVAGVLAACVKRGGELLARYGGEEFVVLLPCGDLAAATAVAQRCLDSLQSARIPHRAAPASEWLTLSIGVASSVPAQGVSPDTLVQRADAALYAAKKLGRGQYASADPSPSKI